MHIAVGNYNSTIRVLLTTFILGASTTTFASHINPISYNNDRINNICFQKYLRSRIFFNFDDSHKPWKQVALAACRLSSKEIRQSYSKSN